VVFSKYLVYSTDKTDHRYMNEILLEVTLSTHNPKFNIENKDIFVQKVLYIIILQPFGDVIDSVLS
jgi:hypothetical protein